MTGTVVAPMALLGSGEFEPWAEEGDLLLLSLATGDGSAAILPLASAPEGETYPEWRTRDSRTSRNSASPLAWSSSRSAVTPSKRN
jgi:hypothetical protein